MFHGGGSRICLARGADGKAVARQPMPNGKPEWFTEGTGARDVTLLRAGGGWNAACYAASLDKQGADYVRTSKDLIRWSPSKKVDFGVDADRYLVGCMPVAAPEPIEHEGRL
jgi:hypothetical protein